MIDSLIEAKLITQKEYKLYCLFSSDLGRECFKDMTDEIFWEEPDEAVMTEGVLGLYEGRRSVLRGIKSVIDKVEYLIHEQNIEVKHD